MSGALAYKNIEVSYLCDVMDNQIKKASERYFNLTGKTTKSEKNIHRIFEDKDVDAIIMATLIIGMHMVLVKQWKVENMCIWKNLVVII